MGKAGMLQPGLLNKSDNLVARLIADIQAGLLPGGSSLPSERQLGLNYGGSRTVVRESLQRLLDREILVRNGRQISVHAQALRNLEATAPEQSALRVAMLLKPGQIANPIIHQILEHFNRHSAGRFRLTILPRERYLRETIGQLRDYDLLLAFGYYLDDLQLDELASQTGGMLLLNNPNPRFNYISPDHYAGGRMMAECLFRHNHRNIGAVYLTGEHFSEFTLRFNGARDFLAEHDIGIKTSPANMSVNAHQPGIYQQAFDYLYKQDSGITAVIGCWDGIVTGLYELLAARGIRIPDDISLIGFDDQFASRFLNPPLTTVRYPAEAVGLALAEAVMGFEQGKKISIQQNIAPLLLLRESVKMRHSGEQES